MGIPARRRGGNIVDQCFYKMLSAHPALSIPLLPLFPWRSGCGIISDIV